MKTISPQRVFGGRTAKPTVSLRETRRKGRKGTAKGKGIFQEGAVAEKHGEKFTGLPFSVLLRCSEVKNHLLMAHHHPNFALHPFLPCPLTGSALAAKI
jgi:hypothetical protein